MIRLFATLRTMIAYLAILAGAPILLIAISGPPWPDRKPSSEQVQAYLDTPMDPEHISTTGQALAWSVWLLVMAGVSALMVARARSRDWRRSWERVCYYLPGPMQSLAAGLLGTASVATASTALPAHAAPLAPAAAPAGNPLTAEPASQAGHTVTVTHEDPAGSTRTVKSRNASTVKVHRGDTLWDISGSKLGDPHRWPEIYKLNRDKPQPNGFRLTDPDEIDVGWILKIPSQKATALPKEVGPPHAGPTVANPEMTAPAPATPEHNSSLSQSATSNSTAPTGPARAGHATSHKSTDAPDRAAVPPSEAHGSTDGTGIALPTQGWVSLGLAALIAGLASARRLHRRRHARLSLPKPARLTPQPSPLPESLTPVESTDNPVLLTESDPPQPITAAPIGIDAIGCEINLFDVSGPGLALHGPGAEASGRALLAAVLATGAPPSAQTRPIVVTTRRTLTRLLPGAVSPTGIDPDGISFDGERLIVLADAAAAVTHAEEEMILRRRLLDTFNAGSIADLNARTDHAEAQPAYVLLIEANPRHAPRLRAVAAHRAALYLHPVVLGELDGMTAVEVAADGTTGDEQPLGLRRLSTLAATDLAAVLAALADTTPRPEPGHGFDDPAGADEEPITTSTEATADQAEPVPAQTVEINAPVRLQVLGPVRITTDTGPVTTGMRSGSYTVLASLAVHPAGRSLEQLAAALHPDTEPATAAKRIRTDINTTRRVLRTATGSTEEMFVVYDPATGRYQLDVQLFAVDLWQMLTAIERANTAPDDAAALTALREAADLYGGDFAEGQDRAWITDYAGSYRHQILAVYARIAEIIEMDQPEQAIAALQHAIGLDPINEELYQRIMRIHGRAQRPDAVRQTLRRLEERLADLDAEPSDATRRVAERQLRPVTSEGHR